MKRILLSLLILACLLLSACGERGAQNRFAAFSEELKARESLAFTADVRAEYPEWSREFTLRYEKAPEEERVTVLAPALVEGVSATISGTGAALVYDGLILDAPPLDPYGLTPMNALSKLTAALTGGSLDSHWEEDGHFVYKLILDDHLAVTVWFDAGMTPKRAELMSDGNVSVFCEITEWS